MKSRDALVVLLCNRACLCSSKKQESGVVTKCFTDVSFPSSQLLGDAMAKSSLLMNSTVTSFHIPKNVTWLECGLLWRHDGSTLETGFTASMPLWHYGGHCSSLLAKIASKLPMVSPPSNVYTITMDRKMSWRYTKGWHSVRVRTVVLH